MEYKNHLILFHGAKNKIIGQPSIEYSENNNLVKTLIINEYGLEDIRYEDSPILTIIRKMVNGEIVI